MLVSGLHCPIVIPWVASGKKLYILDAGTNANQFKDGTLKVVTGLH